MNETKKTTRKKCVLMELNRTVEIQSKIIANALEVEDVDNFEFEGVFLCQRLKLKTSLSHIMAM